MSNILALDVGESRIGVAIASTIARLPSPLTTIQNSTNVWEEIRSVAAEKSANVIVVGLPRNLAGQDTDQTRYVRNFVQAAGDDVQVVFQDEALTSKKAEQELNRRGKPFTKGDIDALAATYILEDYLGQHRE